MKSLIYNKCRSGLILTLFIMIAGFGHSQSEPQRVSPGLISNNTEYCTTVTADGQTMYFARQFKYGDAIMRSDRIDGQWSEPVEVNFTGKFSDTDPLLSPDDKTLYFMTNRNQDQTGFKEDYDIWASEWSEEKSNWGAPYRLPDFINTSFMEGFPSVTSDGTMYFFRANKAIRSDHDIWMAEKIGGGFDTPYKVRGDINTEEWDGHPFVDADNRFMIFYSYRAGGYGRCDLYISFNNNGNWTAARNIGDLVNTGACEMVPFVTRNSKTLYFSRIENGNRDIYQVDFQPILKMVNDSN